MAAESGVRVVLKSDVIMGAICSCLLLLDVTGTSGICAFSQDCSPSVFNWWGFLWPPYVIGQAVYIFILLFVLSSFLFFFPRLISAVGDWMSAIHPHMVCPLCKFRMQVWNMLHATCWKCRTKKSPKSRQLRTMVQLCRAISSQLRHVSTIGKHLFSNNTSFTCPDNMVNFGPIR